MQRKGGYRSRKRVDPFYKSPGWFKARQKCLVRDGFQCVNCGVSVRGKGKAHIHHKLPRKKFPDLALHLPNLVTWCHQCHRAEHYRDTLGMPTAPIGPDGFPIGTDWDKD